MKNLSRIRCCHKKVFLFCFFSLITFSVFARDSKIPEWFGSDKVKKAYPDAKYIAQIGSGKKEADAKTDAISAIGRYFQTTVNSNLSTSLKSIDDGKTLSESNYISNDVTVTSNVQLLGVTFSEPYYEKKSKKYYCVAFIEREYAWKQFVPKIESEKTSFYEFYNEALMQAEEEPLLAARYFVQAKKQGVKFLETLEYGRLINEEKEKVYNLDRAEIASISKKQTDIILNSHLFFNINGDFEELVYNKMQKLFSESGFILAKDKQESHYIVNIKVNPNMLIEDEGTDIAAYTAMPSIEIVISGANSQKSIFSFSEKASKNSMSYSRENVLRKSYSLLLENVEDNLIEKLYAVVYGE